MRKLTMLAAAVLMALPAIAQQLNLPRPSPKASVMQTVGLTDMTIVYSRPSVKGRPIWGALVPYDKVWRTGANEATTIAFTNDVSINGQKLAAGTYSLHTIPAQSGDWTLIFNSVANQWGSFTYDQTKDALRVKATPIKGDFHELLTFDVPEVSADSAKVVLRWENLAVPFSVTVNTTQNALANVRSAIAAAKADDWQTRYRGAQFAFNNNVALDEGAKWLDQSIATNSNINNLWLKAQWQAKMGDKAGATKTAQAAIAKAGPKDAEEVSEIQKQMSAWK
ncbi:MAG: DUF2911 domain-containing protein [Thermoanaerobaculia bacterium]